MDLLCNFTHRHFTFCNQGRIFVVEWLYSVTVKSSHGGHSITGTRPYSYNKKLVAHFFAERELKGWQCKSHLHCRGEGQETEKKKLRAYFHCKAT